MPDGAFEAFPVNNWYNFMPLAKGRMLTAEEEWERRNPVRNHLCIKQQPRWKDQEEDEKEKPGARKPLSCIIRKRQIPYDITYMRNLKYGTGLP